MSTTTLFHTTNGHEATTMEEQASDKMERSYIEMEERLKKMTLEMEALQMENEALRRHDVGSEEGTDQDHNKQDDESQSKGGQLWMIRKRKNDAWQPTLSGGKILDGKASGQILIDR